MVKRVLGMPGDRVRVIDEQHVSTPSLPRLYCGCPAECLGMGILDLARMPHPRSRSLFGYGRGDGLLFPSPLGLRSEASPFGISEIHSLHPRPFLPLPLLLLPPLPQRHTRTVRVPPGHVWLQGDNVTASRDSRLYGPVPLGLVRYRVAYRLWPLAEAGPVEQWELQGGLRVPDRSGGARSS